MTCDQNLWDRIPEWCDHARA